MIWEIRCSHCDSENIKKNRHDNVQVECQHYYCQAGSELLQKSILNLNQSEFGCAKSGLSVACLSVCFTQCEQADIVRMAQGVLADAAFPLLSDETLSLLNSAEVRLFLIHG